MILRILDIFFVVFHTSLILFNVFGWIWKKTRRVNLVTLLITGGSWFLLGIFYGMGYCPLTDWHFNVLRKLGKVQVPASYTEYLAERLTGLDYNSEMVDQLTLVVFLVALGISIFLNISDYRKKWAKN